MKTTLFKARLWWIVILLVMQSVSLTLTGRAHAQPERKADIVFVIDTTGSMGGTIESVKSNINQFVTDLTNRGINARLGLVTFKDIYADGTGSTQNMGWFANANDFRNRLSGVSVSGGGDDPESDVDGLEEARRMSYQPLTKKFIILITDTYYKEGTRYDTPGNPITMSKEVQLLKNDNIVTSVVAPSHYQSTYSSLYTETGGIFSDINTSFAASLSRLADAINTNSPPTLEVLAPDANQIFGQAGTELLPRVKVSDSNGDSLVCNYYIDSETTPRDSKTITNTTTAQTVSFLGTAFSGLSEGNHILKLEVSDNWDAPVVTTIGFFVDKSAPVIGNINYSLKDTELTVTGSATDAPAGLASQPYRYSVGTAVSSWTAGSYTVSNLTPNASYHIMFEAKDRLENTATQEGDVYTFAQIPIFSVTASTESTLTIRFSDLNPSYTKYQVKVGSQYLQESGVLAATPFFIAPSNKQIMVRGLTAGEAYTIQAMAVNQAGINTYWSNEVTGTTIANPPAVVTTVKKQTEISLSWPIVAGATGYDLEADGIIVDNGTASSYVHGGLSPETQHAYRVRVRNAGGIGAWSNGITVSTLPYPPQQPSISASQSSQTEVTIGWDRVAKADSYDIEADGQVVELGNVTSYTRSGLEADTDHKFRLRARNAGGASTWSGVVTQRTLPYPPERPDLPSAELAIHSVNISWKDTERAVTYEVEADGIIVDNAGRTSYLHDGLEALSGHTYRVRAVNAGGKSNWSEPLNVTTHPEKPLVPTNLMATSDTTSITLSWYKVSHAESYEIEVDGTTIVPLLDSRYTQSDLSPASSHTYRVRAHNISGYSPWSNIVKMDTLPYEAGAADYSLTNVAAIVTNKTITISWDSVAAEAQYQVEVDGTTQDNGTNTIYSHGGLSANEYHTYRIRVKNPDDTSRWVAVLSLSTLPDPPDALGEITGYAQDYSIELRWDKVDGATGYDVEIDGKKIHVDGASSYLDQNLTPGTAHTYRVRATNVTGVTAWSPALVKSTTNPTYSVNIIQNEIFGMSLFAYNVQDFWEKSFVVTYDPAVLDIDDLYDFTPRKETNSSGAIPDSPLSVTVTQGRIVYKVNRNIVPGTSWSGEIATVRFKAKSDGITAVNVTLE